MSERHMKWYEALAVLLLLMGAVIVGLIAG